MLECTPSAGCRDRHIPTGGSVLLCTLSPIAIGSRSDDDNNNSAPPETAARRLSFDNRQTLFLMKKFVAAPIFGSSPVNRPSREKHLLLILTERYFSIKGRYEMSLGALTHFSLCLMFIHNCCVSKIRSLTRIRMM